jgi:hypothetical protein
MSLGSTQLSLGAVPISPWEHYLSVVWEHYLSVVWEHYLSSPRSTSSYLPVNRLSTLLDIFPVNGLVLSYK